MIARTWEASFLDWTAPGRFGDPVAPDDVMALLGAASEEEATRAYWRLDGYVCANGIVYRAALSVTRMILALVPSCPYHARRGALELLGQIAAGESAPSSPGVREECLAELRQAAWWLLHGLQFDRVELAGFYADLIGMSGEEYPDFRACARQYLGWVLTRDLPEAETQMIQNTIAGLA